MQNFKLTIAGIDRQVSPYRSEGQNAELINLCPENGSLRAVYRPSVVANLKGNRKLLFIHRNNDYTHWISYDGTTLYFEAEERGGELLSRDERIAALPGIVRIESIGNTLIAVGPTSKQYLLYKERAYRFLGDMPTVPVAGLNVLTHFDDYLSEPYNLDISKAFLYPTLHESFRKQVTNVIFGAVAKETDGRYEEGFSLYPVNLRYALRLYDGSYIYHSAPYLMTAVDFRNTIRVEFGESDQLLEKIQVKVRIKRPVIEYEIAGLDPDWFDIVRSVDLFLSRPVALFDFEGEVTRFVKNGTVYIADLPRRSENEIRKEILDASLFYLVKSHPLSGNSTAVSGIIHPQNKELKNLVSRENLSDDYDSHCALSAGTTFVYNNKLHLGEVRKKLFGGFLPVNLSSSGDMKSITVSTLIKTDAGPAEVVVTHDLGTARCSGRILPYLFYPDVRAYRMYVTEVTDSGTKKGVYPLVPHPALNGAYYLQADLEATLPDGAHAHVHTERNASEYLPNRLYVSAVDNPFSFPLEQIYTVSSGRILGMAAATAALSQGQFGQFPLYVFTEDGIWALEVGETVYRSQHPVSRHVCNRAASITPLDNSIVFSTRQGIVRLFGSETEHLSQPLENEVFDVRNRLPRFDRFLALTDDTSVAAAIDTVRFSDYLEQATIGYDYCHNRLVVSNPDRPYCYLYSLADRCWSKQSGRYNYLLNSYPDLYASSGSDIIRLSVRLRPEEREQPVPVAFVTRPFQLLPDELKRIRRAVVRNGRCRSSLWLYGSRDGEEWSLVAVADALRADRPIRPLSAHGSPWRFFVLAYRAEQHPVEPIGHIDLDVETLYRNKLR